jgi:hypothetical protein
MEFGAFMNAKNKPLWIRLTRKVLLGAVVGASVLGGSGDCSAHFPHRNWCWGAGWYGGLHYSSYRGFATSRTFLYPSYGLHHYRPVVHYYRPMAIRPSYVNPWCHVRIQYYTPVQYCYPVQCYAPPVCVTPICSVPINAIPDCPSPLNSIQVGYAPLAYSRTVISNSRLEGLASASWNKPSVASLRNTPSPYTPQPIESWQADRDEFAKMDSMGSEFLSVQPPIRLVSTEMELSKQRTPSRSVLVAKPAIKPLTPTSVAWSDSANGIIDEMVLSGDMRSALNSCEAMANDRQPRSKGVYLRHAILKLFTPETETDVEKVLELLNMSAAAGCELQPSELGVSSLREYLEPSRISLQETLNQFSQNAMQNKTDSAADILMIATLLKLDGQSERAKLFATEAFEKASTSDNFVWHSLLAAVSK